MQKLYTYYEIKTNIAIWRKNIKLVDFNFVIRDKSLSK